MLLSFDWILENIDNKKDTHVSKKAEEELLKKEEKHGDQQGILNHIKENVFTYFNEDDKELRNLDFTIENIENGYMPRNILSEDPDIEDFARFKEELWTGEAGWDKILPENQDQANKYLEELTNKREKL